MSRDPRDLQNDALFYTSLLGPPSLGQDHSSCSFDSRACTASNVNDSKEYINKHAVDGCECDYIVIPTGSGSECAVAIERGDIPIVHLQDDGEDLSVDICPHRTKPKTLVEKLKRFLLLFVPWVRRSNPIPYTALSHVWADGLGDPKDNRLHRCQMKRLARLLKSLPSHTPYDETSGLLPAQKTTSPSEVSECYFWMDTLCVPVNNQKLRNKAIERMREVYEEAANVLVLDAELMRHSTAGGYKEIFTRISCSNWVRRLWTLQEAIFNRNLLFQFSDRATYVGAGSKLQREQKADNKLRPCDLVAWECDRYSFDFQVVLPYWDRTQQINFIWNALESRTTSRSGDEPLCLAILLGLNLKKFKRQPDAFTVKKFWSLNTQGIPASILFLPGPKLQDEGYRWAPASLIDLKIMGGEQSLTAHVTPRGLRVKYPAFLLSPPQHPVKSVVPFEADGQLFYLRGVTANGSPSGEATKLHKRANLAFLILGLVMGEDTAAGGHEVGLGALVSGGVSKRGVRYGEYLMLISFVKKGSWREQHPNVPYSKEEQQEKLADPCKATYLPVQEWCVS
ncbi:uncharacterized protein BP5553_01075 [Venustampulla echinocandica]|uniref:Heterokaryon incompatibility domain-containing protein n=1 Tax=Venustampulla echinocandica TaxID=2656787 RepID=A0A370TZZ4_9HELO|nr:uncharacterized protein BP5553_01075 [Venustampulla echinocandica]RDL41096.1 hypothetical protein BP5553_01075 [Venustampulla echinocandica]